MNILILYPFYNQKGLMHNFSLKLKEYGVYADTICIANFYTERNTNIKWPSYIEYGFKYVYNSREGIVRRVIRKVYRERLIQRLLYLYELVDFHAYYRIYNKYMRTCINKNVKFDITLWGSDIMRANEESKKLLRYGFKHCYRIKLSDNLHDVLQESYGTIYDEKCRIVYFGNSDLPVIDSLTDSEIEEIKQKLYGDTKGKKIVVCGYNNIPFQNHENMIEALSKLSEEEKKAIHVVLPMTYGGKKKYRNNIRSQIEEQLVSYTLLDTFLDTKEVAVIRKTADIVINVQDTDAIAGSLQDHLYCGNVCIFGEWLNYSPYTNNDIYYIKTSMDGIADHLKDVLHNYEKYQGLISGNHEKIKSLFSWEATIQKQASVYGE